MAAQNIIVIGASAGGLSAMRDLFRTLDPQLQAAIFVVRHFPTTSESLLPGILRRCTNLPVDHARNSEPIRPGHVSIAPAGYHMTLREDGVRLTFGPRINNARPAIDPLFFSAQGHSTGASPECCSRAIWTTAWPGCSPFAAPEV